MEAATEDPVLASTSALALVLVRQAPATANATPSSPARDNGTRATQHAAETS